MASSYEMDCLSSSLNSLEKRASRRRTQKCGRLLSSCQRFCFIFCITISASFCFSIDKFISSLPEQNYFANKNGRMPHSPTLNVYLMRQTQIAIYQARKNNIQANLHIWIKEMMDVMMRGLCYSICFVEDIQIGTVAIFLYSYLIEQAYIMLIQAKFERLIRGEPVTLAESELSDFESYCTEESILPDQLSKIAVQIYKQNPSHAIRFLRFFNTHTKDKYQAPHYNETRITLHTCLSVLALGQAIRGIDEEVSKEEYYTLSLQELLKAEQVYGQPTCVSILNRAIVHFFEGEVGKCLSIGLKLEDELSHQLNQKALLTATQLMLAQCFFSKKSYDKALDYYKKCFVRNKWLSLKARMGMAYCYFAASKYELARACAQRVLQLNSKYVDAILCLAIIYQRNEDYQKYLEHLKQAYDINQTNPLLLYLIAEHFLLKGEVQKSQQMCIKGLNCLTKFSRFIKKSEGARNDFGQLQNRFINLQGQIQHKRKNFSLAIQYYSKIAEKQLLQNDLSLVQCLIMTGKSKEAIERMEHTYKVYDKEKRDCRFLKDTYRIMAYLKRKSKPSQDPKDVIFYYNEAIKFDKNDPSLKQELSYILTINDDSHKARRVMQELEKMLQANSQQPKPQILINSGVLAVESHQREEGEQKLIKAIERINYWDDLDLNQQKGFLIIAKYNYAICLQKENINYRALSIYEENIALNSCHLSSILRKSYIFQKIGNHPQAISTLDSAQILFQQRIITQIHIEKIRLMKAYLLYLQQKYEEALSVLGTIMPKKPDSVYYKVLQFSIKYAALACNQSRKNELKDLLIAGKTYFDSICEKDCSEIFCYMIVTTINASLGLLVKEQGSSHFKKMLANVNKIPAIRYNMGLYYMSQMDEEAAISCFNQHRQNAQSNKAEQLIAHQYLVNKDYKKAIKITRKNILQDPTNLKYRAQLILATQARCEDELPNNNKRFVFQNHQQTKKCVQGYKFFENSNISSLKNAKKKDIATLIKQLSIEKSASIKALFDKYDKKVRQIIEKDRPKDNGVATIKKEDNDSQNEEEKRVREVEQKKKKALAISKLKTQNLTQSWNMISEKQKAAELEKPKRKAPKCQQHAGEISPKKRERPKDKRDDNTRAESEDYYNVSSSKKEKTAKVKKEVKQEPADDESLKKYLVE